MLNHLHTIYRHLDIIYTLNHLLDKSLFNKINICQNLIENIINIIGHIGCIVVMLRSIQSQSNIYNNLKENLIKQEQNIINILLGKFGTLHLLRNSHQHIICKQKCQQTNKQHKYLGHIYNNYRNWLYQSKVGNSQYMSLNLLYYMLNMENCIISNFLKNKYTDRRNSNNQMMLHYILDKGNHIFHMYYQSSDNILLYIECIHSIYNLHNLMNIFYRLNQLNQKRSLAHK